MMDILSFNVYQQPKFSSLVVRDRHVCIHALPGELMVEVSHSLLSEERSSLDDVLVSVCAGEDGARRCWLVVR